MIAAMSGEFAARRPPGASRSDSAADLHFDELAAELDLQVRSGLRPSLQVCVDWRGECVFERAVGRDASVDRPYVLWSTTKPFIALALLALIEDGRASLDDRVARTIPEFAVGGKRSATIAHVLSHRGGFPDNTPELRRELFRVSRDWSAALDCVCAMPAAWEPGSARGYHPLSGWFIVGELVQRLADRPLAEVLRERVLDPAGIGAEGFSFGTPQRLAAPPMTVYTREERGAPPQAEADWWNAPEAHAALIPGASGIARARDVVRLYRTLLRGGEGPGGRVLSPESVRRATFPHAVGTRDRTFLRDIPWGLGFHLKHVIPALDDCGTRATPGTFGHGGHFLVNTAWADPERDLAVCILANGLCAPKPGLRAVTALSDAIHVAIDRACAAAAR